MKITRILFAALFLAGFLGACAFPKGPGSLGDTKESGGDEVAAVSTTARAQAPAQSKLSSRVTPSVADESRPRKAQEDKRAADRPREESAKIATREPAGRQPRDSVARPQERESSAQQDAELAAAERVEHEKVLVEARRLDDEVNDCFQPKPERIRHSGAPAGAASACPDCLEVTVKNTGPRIVAEICFSYAAGSTSDCAKERIGFGETARRLSSAPGPSSYRVRYVGSKVPANDWECVSWLGFFSG